MQVTITLFFFSLTKKKVTVEVLKPTGPVKKYSNTIARTLNDKFCGRGHPFPFDSKKNSVKDYQKENNLVEGWPLCVFVCVCVCITHIQVYCITVIL